MSTSTPNRMFVARVVAIAGGVSPSGAMFLYLVAGPDGTRESTSRTHPVGATA
jgi:hypothetical protein